jgi:hypothetical protein
MHPSLCNHFKASFIEVKFLRADSAPPKTSTAKIYGVIGSTRLNIRFTSKRTSGRACVRIAPKIKPSAAPKGMICDHHQRSGSGNFVQILLRNLVVDPASPERSHEKIRLTQNPFFQLGTNAGVVVIT